MHRLVVTLGALVCAAIAVPAATADQPSRAPLPASTFTISGSCSFDVRIDIVTNKEYITTFASGKQIITGQLVVRATNLSDPTKSLVLQISGPGIEDVAHPETFNLNGTSLFFYPGVLLLTRGPATITFDSQGNATFSQTSASAVDICAALS